MRSTTAPADHDILIRAGRVVFYASLFVAPWGISRVAGITVGDALTLAAAAIGVLAMVKRTRVPTSFMVGAALIVLACLVLGITVGNISEQLAIAVRMFFVLVLIPFAALRFLHTEAQLTTAALSYVAGSAVSSVVAVGQFLGVDVRNYFLADVVAASSRFAGLNFHPNGQAGSLGVATALALVLVVYGARARLAILLVIANIAGLAISASVTGLLGVGVALLLVLVRARKFALLVKLAIVGGLGVLAWTALNAVFPSLVTPFDRLAGGLNTGSLRLLTVDYALTYLRQDLYGGIGFANDSGGTFDNRTQVHNIFVLAWYQGGALFLLAFVVVVLTVLRMSWRRMSGAREAAVVASLTALFYAQTGPALYDRFIWVPIALLVAAHMMSRQAKSADPPVSPINIHLGPHHLAHCHGARSRASRHR